MKTKILRSLPLLGAVAFALNTAGPAEAQTTPTSRSATKWPFSAQSIWNMPIGSNAVYVGVNMPPLGLVAPDVEYIYKSTSADPLRPVHLVSGDFTRRVPNYETPSYVSVHIPDNFVVPDATTNPYYTPNNCAAFIEPDGVTIYELEPLTRPVAGGRVYAYNASNSGNNSQNIKGPGQWGSHFGSSLSTLGGSIRSGELSGTEPIRHAIKLELDAHVLWKDPADASKSYRWPAYNADGYTGGYGVYNKTDKALSMGALLAIPPTVTAASLNLQTPQAKKIFAALQDYGAYIVDTSGDGYKENGNYTVNICAEKAVADSEFDLLAYPGKNDAWFNDFKKILAALKVVDNNSAQSIGGGGTPRQPLAPPFDDEVTTPPTTPATGFSGVYKITARHSGKALDVAGGSGATANGTNVHQWDYLGGTNQQWTITATTDGYYKLINRNSGKALDVAGGSGATANGTNVHQWEYVGGTNQQWKLEKIASAAANRATATAATSLAQAEGLALYPNPADQTVALEYNSTDNGSVRVEILNTVGQVMQVVELPAQSGFNKLTVDVHRVPKGAYFLRVVPASGAARTQRLLIAR